MSAFFGIGNIFKNKAKYNHEENILNEPCSSGEFPHINSPSVNGNFIRNTTHNKISQSRGYNDISNKDRLTNFNIYNSNNNNFCNQLNEKTYNPENNNFDSNQLRNYNSENIQNWQMSNNNNNNVSNTKLNSFTYHNINFLNDANIKGYNRNNKHNQLQYYYSQNESENFNLQNKFLYSNSGYNNFNKLNSLSCKEKSYINDRKANLISKGIKGINSKENFSSTSKYTLVKNPKSLYNYKHKIKISKDKNSDIIKLTKGFLHVHHKKSVINSYFEKNDDKNKMNNSLKSQNFNGIKDSEDEINDLNMQKSKPRVSGVQKKDSNGFFMLKKDFFIQNLLEKGGINNNNINCNHNNNNINNNNVYVQSSSSSIIKNVLKKEDSNNIVNNNLEFKNSNCNLEDSSPKPQQAKLKKENTDYEANLNNEKLLSPNSNRLKHSKATLKPSKLELKFSTNLLIKNPGIIKDTIDQSPKKIQETISVRNFSYFKLFPKNSQRRFLNQHKKNNSLAISHNSSNFISYDFNKIQRKCNSSNRNLDKKQNEKQDRLESPEDKIVINNDIDKINSEAMHEKINSENKINANNVNHNGNNFNKLKVKFRSNNELQKVFLFDKSSKLNYYHARELSAFSRERKKRMKLYEETQDKESNTITMNNEKQKSLHLNIYNKYNLLSLTEEKVKKPLLSITPNIVGNNIDNKLFNNEFIKGNLDKDSMLKIYYDVKDDFTEANKSLGSSIGHHRTISVEVLKRDYQRLGNKNNLKESSDNALILNNLNNRHEAENSAIKSLYTYKESQFLDNINNSPNEKSSKNNTEFSPDKRLKNSYDEAIQNSNKSKAIHYAQFSNKKVFNALGNNSESDFYNNKIKSLAQSNIKNPNSSENFAFNNLNKNINHTDKKNSGNNINNINNQNSQHEKYYSAQKSKNLIF